MALKANFTKCSLIVPETRCVADLLLAGISTDEWRQRIEIDNVLQKKTRNSAITYASLARSRLMTMDAPLWELVRDGSSPEATDGALAATIKFSPLFGQFLSTVVRDCHRRYLTELPASAWDDYLDDMQRTHSEMPSFNDSTRVKLRQNAMRMLQEAGFIESTRHLVLRKRQTEPRVLAYLNEHKEDFVMECIQA